jgi:hypothetical protein
MRRLLVADVAVVLAGAAVLWFHARDEGPARPPRTWIIQDGHTGTFDARDLVPTDRFRCSGGGGIDGVPPPGQGVGGSDGVTASTSTDGTFTIRCPKGSRGNY